MKSRSTAGHDLIWSPHIKMLHKRNNEEGESQCCEQLPKPLSLISAGSLELDKLPFFYVIRNRCPTFFLLKTSLSERSIHLPHLQQPPPHTQASTLDNPVHSASFQNTPFTYLASSLCVYIYSAAFGLNQRSAVFPRSSRLLRQLGDIANVKNKPCNISYCSSTAHYPESLL